MAEVIEKSEELNVEEKAKKEDEISSKLSSLEKKVEGTEVLARLMSDPDVRRLLEAKQRGEKVKVVEDKVDVPLSLNIDDTDYDTLSNKELVAHTLKQITRSLDSVLASKLEPITKSIKSLESYVGNTEAKTVAQQIDEVKKKYSDFENYLPAMRELNKSNPDLNVEELYLISKRRKIGPEVLRVSTEKPSSSSARVVEKKREIPLPIGKAGFDQLLDEALNKLEFPED